MEAADEKRLLRLQKQLVAYHLLIIDELGVAPEACFQHDSRYRKPAQSFCSRSSVNGMNAAEWALAAISDHEENKTSLNE